MEQLERLTRLIGKISSPMLDSMLKAHQGGTVMDFWMVDWHRADRLINLFEVDVASE
jgi:hypothetical protein